MSNTYGDGSWRKRGKRWEYRFRVTDPVTGMNVYRSVSGDTKTECRDAAHRLRREVKASGTAIPSRASKPITLGEWSEKWRSEYLPASKRASNTIKQYDSLLRTHVEATPLANVRLTALTGLGIETHIEGRDIAASSKRSLHAALAAVLADAVRDRRLGENPIDDAKRPKRPTTRRATQARALSDREVVTILDATADHRWSALIVLALHTGMRRGELAGLKWSDVDLDAGQIHVQRQATIDVDDVEPKTIHGDRIVPLSATARAALVQHGLDEALRLADVEDARHDLVFTNGHGQAVDLRTLSRWYAKHAQASGLSVHGLHAHRHTFASRALAAGVPITDVSAWLGHADPSITLALYSWALPGNKTTTIDLLDQHMAGLSA